MISRSCLAACVWLLIQASPSLAQEQDDCPAAPLPTTPDPALELVGYWSGGIEQGGAIVPRLGVDFTAGPCGGVTGAMDSPDQGAEDIPVGPVQLTGDSVRFAVPAVAGSFRGVLDRERARAARIELRYARLSLVSAAVVNLTLRSGENRTLGIHL